VRRASNYTEDGIPSGRFSLRGPERYETRSGEPGVNTEAGQARAAHPGGAKMAGHPSVKVALGNESAQEDEGGKRGLERGNFT